MNSHGLQHRKYSLKIKTSACSGMLSWLFENELENVIEGAGANIEKNECGV